MQSEELKSRVSQLRDNLEKELIAKERLKQEIAYVENQRLQVENQIKETLERITKRFDGLLKETNNIAAIKTAELQSKVDQTKEYEQEIRNSIDKVDRAIAAVGTLRSGKNSTEDNDENSDENYESVIEEVNSVHLEYQPSDNLSNAMKENDFGEIKALPCSVDITKCTVGGPGSILVGEESFVAVETKNAKGVLTYCERDKTTLVIETRNGERAKKVFQSYSDMTGKYKFPFIATQPGVHYITVNVNGQGSTNAHEVLAKETDKEFVVCSPLGVSSIKINESTSLLFVCDRQNHQVQVFYSNGKFSRQFGSGVLKQPCGIVHLLNNDLLLVSDVGDDTIQMFSSTGEFVRTFCRKGHGHGQVRGPLGLSLGENGNVLVCDSMNHRVQVLTPRGEFIRTIGEGHGLHFRYCAYYNGLYYITASGNTSVMVYNNQGECVDIFRDQEGNFHTLNQPRGLDVSADGSRVVVCEKDGHRLHVYEGGVLVKSIGSLGRQKGQFNMPHGVKWLGDSRIIISDYNNNRIQILDSDNTSLYNDNVS